MNRSKGRSSAASMYYPQPGVGTCVTCCLSSEARPSRCSIQFYGHSIWFPELATTAGTIASLGIYCGLTFWLTQVARDRGKRLEPDLYQSWGGKPTSIMLRHRDRSLPDQLKERYKSLLLRQVPNIRLPSEAEENRDPAAADDAYEAAVAWLRTATRDRARFPLVAQESVYFGFRRNLLALRLYVLLSIGLSEAANVAGGAHSYLESGTLPNPQVTLVTTLIALFSAFVPLKT